MSETIQGAALKAVREMNRPQRAMFQTWRHVEKVIDYLYEFRDGERRQRHFDSVQDLTEAIYHIKQAMAHLRRVSRNKYNREPEDLKVWQ